MHLNNFIMQLLLVLAGLPMAIASYPVADSNDWHPPVDGDCTYTCPLEMIVYYVF